MIHIKYKVKPSNLSGVGLFADQDIKKDDLIYTPNQLLDVDLTQEQFDTLDPVEQAEVRYYGYWNKYSNRWHVAFESIRFLNHGELGVANVTQDEEMVMVAVRDISAGEELLQDYKEIYSADDKHFANISG